MRRRKTSCPHDQHRGGYARYLRLADDPEMRERMMMLDAYLCDRACVEGVAYELDPEVFLAWFAGGTRTFFGVDLDGDGQMLRDWDEPSPGYFAGWHGTGCSRH